MDDRARMFEEWVMADQKSREATAREASARIAWEKAEADRERAAARLNPEASEAARDAHIQAVAEFNGAISRANSARHLERFQWLRYCNAAHKEMIGCLAEIRGAVNQNSRMYNEGRLKDASILCEIRDLLTKMANPPVMVSLESTPESRAASRAEKMAEMEEGCSVTAGSLDDGPFDEKVVKQISEALKQDSVYKQIVDRALAREKAKDGSPANDGSEAADERDRALGRRTRQAMLEQGFLDASSDAGWYLHLLRRVIRMSALTVETCPAGYPDVADFLREEAGRT